MKNTNNSKFFLYGIVVLFILRLFLNGYIPLMDKTEARYAEIARIMVETDNWVTPQIDYGVPFWAKPPLSTWLSALSMKIFGINEFAVRLPYLILSLILVVFMRRFVTRKNSFYLTGFILLTIPEFLLHAGVVSTDTVLSFCVVMIFLTFWKAINNDKLTYWGYLLFVFVGFGLLSKGPIVLILTMPPIFVWLLYFRKFKTVFKRLPWVLGLFITSIISVPWYYLAELKTNGFLNYFIVGEHFRRFFDSTWQGDKYGFPKSQPIGIIWLFLFAFAFPWIQILAVRLWKHKKDILSNKWVLYLLFWLIWTPLFFTVSKSLIHTYILPVMIPIALLVEHFWDGIKNKTTSIVLSSIFPFAIIITLALSLFNNNLEQYSNTDKYLLQNQVDDINIYFLGTKSYSSQFYSKGKIQSISHKFLKEKINLGESFKIIIPNKSLSKLEIETINQFQVLTFNKKSKLYLHIIE